MNIAFRVSEPSQKLTGFYDQLAKVSTHLIVYEHSASQVHIHGLVVDCKVSTDTLKNWIKKHLGIKAYDKSKWSFKTEYESKPVDYNFITYMSKGKLEPVFNTLPMSEVDGYKNQWIQPERYSSKEKEDKITIWNIAQEADQIYRSQYEEFEYGSGEGDIVIERMVPIIIKLLRKYKKGFDEFMVKKIFITAMSSHERFSRVIMDKLKFSFTR